MKIIDAAGIDMEKLFFYRCNVLRREATNEKARQMDERNAQLFK